MKKILLIFSLVLLSRFGFSQTIFKPVKIDSLVTVSLPKIYQKKDTVNQTIFTSQGLYGYMVVIRLANAKNNTPLKKEKDLNKVFNDYMKGVQAQVTNGSIMNIGDTTVGTLKAKVFTLQVDNGGSSLECRKFILLYTQDATYTFEYYYHNTTAYLIGDELHGFTSSIKLSPGLQRNDQYLATGPQKQSPLVKYAPYAGGLVVIIIIIAVVISRRRRNAKKLVGRNKKS
jgi:hypothetical protein